MDAAAEDDDVSFLSISDSDVESESVGSYATCSIHQEIARANSPALSVTSNRSFCRRSTPKRRAPEPPAAMPGVESTKTKPSSSFRQEFKKCKEVGPMEAFPTSSVSEFGATVGSHPIELLPQQPPTPLKETTALEQISPPSTSFSVNEDGRFLLKGPTRDFSKLQIRLIDDDSEAFGSPLTVSTYIPPQTPSEFIRRNVPLNSSPSSVFPAATYASPSQFSPQFLPPNISPPTPSFYTSTVNMGGVPNAALANPYLMPQLSICAKSNTAMVSCLQNSYYSPHLLESPTSTIGESYSCPQGVVMTTTNSNDPPSPPLAAPKADPGYRLRHSNSAPGLSRKLPSRRSHHVPRRAHRGRLDSLSEEDDSLFSDDTSERVENHGDTRSASSYIGGGGRRPVSRSNSDVTVAHLYEDLLVSSRLKLKVTLTNLTVVVVIAAFFVPNSAALIFSAFRLIFGTLFPAYYSYKAVRTKNVKEYVKWMMYWIVFAFFTCFETITDVFLSFWFPFYYEIKILVVLWLLSPATRGSSILYRKFVHPWLTRREEEIDDCIAKAKQQGYSTVVQLGTKGVNYATTVIMQTAIKGGGGLVNQLKRSYSASEIGEDVNDMNSNVKGKALPLQDKMIIDDDERSISSGSHDSESRNRSESESSSQRMRGHSTGRAVRSTKTRSADVSDMHFLDGNDGVTSQRRSLRAHDVMSTSVGVGGNTQTVTRRARTGDVSNYATLPRTASKRVGAAKKKQT